MEWLCWRSCVGHEESLQPAQPHFPLLTGQWQDSLRLGLDWRMALGPGSGSGVRGQSRDDEVIIVYFYFLFIYILFIYFI